MAHRRGSTCGGTVTCVALLLAACGQATEEPEVPSTPPVQSATATPPPPNTGPEPTVQPPTTTGPDVGQPSASAPDVGQPSASAPDVGQPSASDLEGFQAPGETAQQEATGSVDLVVSGVRVGLQPGFDRVVFDLEGAGTVGWRVEYTDDAAQDGSGAPVDLAGDYVLAVYIQGAGMPGADSTAYDPPQLLVPGTGLTEVTEVLRLTPFEGQVNAFVGVGSERPFRVTRVADPERLVVDIAHG